MASSKRVRTTVTCPQCGYPTPWYPQAKKVMVRCVYRHLTSIRADGSLQSAVQLYTTYDGSKCWTERYLVDSDPNEPDFVTYPCDNWFIVR